MGTGMGMGMGMGKEVFLLGAKNRNAWRKDESRSKGQRVVMYGESRCRLG